MSSICTLEPGDIVATGTPGGVGKALGQLLVPGDVVRVEIDGIGAIKNGSCRRSCPWTPLVASAAAGADPGRGARRPWSVRLLLVLAGLSAFAPLGHRPVSAGVAGPGPRPRRKHLERRGDPDHVRGRDRRRSTVVGPLSDTLGRRRPLIAGLILYIGSSLGCAAAPSIAVLDVLRCSRASPGATGIVIARAMVRDMYSGVEALGCTRRSARSSPWPRSWPPLSAGRSCSHVVARNFRRQAAVGALLLAAAVLITHETLAPAARHPGSVRGASRPIAGCSKPDTTAAWSRPDRSGSPASSPTSPRRSFVYQDVLGFSAQAFGLLFAVNGAACSPPTW